MVRIRLSVDHRKAMDPSASSDDCRRNNGVTDLCEVLTTLNRWVIAHDDSCVVSQALGPGVDIKGVSCCVELDSRKQLVSFRSRRGKRRQVESVEKGVLIKE